MKTLSSNHNGIVKQTSTAGYSVIKTYKQVVKELEKNGFTMDVSSLDRAQTGSIYFSMWKNGQDYDFRISNHTKRFNGIPDDAIEVYNGKNFKGESYSSYNLNIISFETKKEVMSFMSSL